MGKISFKVLNLILSNLDDKPYKIDPIKGFKDMFTVFLDNGEVAQVEVFLHNEGVNFHWLKVNNNEEVVNTVYNHPINP